MEVRSRGCFGGGGGGSGGSSNSSSGSAREAGRVPGREPAVLEAVAGDCGAHGRMWAAVEKLAAVA